MKKAGSEVERCMFYTVPKGGLYVNSEKDGSVIAILERGTPQLAIQGDPNVRFDPLKLTWLGSVSSYANDAYLLQVNASFPAKTVDDLRKPGMPARLGTT